MSEKKSKKRPPKSKYYFMYECLRHNCMRTTTVLWDVRRVGRHPVSGKIVHRTPCKCGGEQVLIPRHRIPVRKVKQNA